MSKASKMNSNAHADGYLSSSDSSIGSWPSPPRNTSRQPLRGRKAPQQNGRDAVARAMKPPRKNKAPVADQRDKENKDPRVGNDKKKRPKSLNNASSIKFGRGNPYRYGKFRDESPRGKPMMLSRRLSYRINNSTPDKSPITAVTLQFTPIMIMPNGRKNRTDRHAKSSLEQLEKLNDNTPSVAKKYGTSKRYSV